eukprot:TRINITY_DN27413_c0_g1_i1.p1 TRINITY_DN27413_c0_g1~~TRINITY_DN27413_c0_g1_i1.p1  ORF type:complete len:119 (+),score=15.04 TRINITY_DN27413_c0_g1_i1:3-359(+)
MELYNEQLLDIFADKKDSVDLKIKKDPISGVVHVQNVTTTKVANAKEMDSLVQKGFSMRRTESTNMNERSSRSHLIFTIMVECKDSAAQTTTYGKMSFIDLAGSERVSKSGGTAVRLK